MLFNFSDILNQSEIKILKELIKDEVTIPVISKLIDSGEIDGNSLNVLCRIFVSEFEYNYKSNTHPFIVFHESFGHFRQVDSLFFSKNKAHVNYIDGGYVSRVFDLIDSKAIREFWNTILVVSIRKKTELNQPPKAV